MSNIINTSNVFVLEAGDRTARRPLQTCAGKLQPWPCKNVLDCYFWAQKYCSEGDLRLGSLLDIYNCDPVMGCRWYINVNAPVPSTTNWNGENGRPRIHHLNTFRKDL